MRTYVHTDRIRRPFFDLNLVWSKINIPWQAEWGTWINNHATSDLFYVLPAHMSEPPAAALAWSGNQDMNCCWGAAHWIYDPLCWDANVGSQNINFIEGGNYFSTNDVDHAWEWPRDDLFLAINRECPPGQWCH